MGILDTLFGRNTEPEKREKDSPMKVQNYYFVDTDPEEKDSILNFELIFGPHGEREGWGLLRTNGAHYFDENVEWAIVIYETGDVVMQDEAGYQVQLGKIIAEENLEADDYEKFDIMPLPEIFVGNKIPEGGEWSDEQLKELTMSLGVSREL